MGVPAFFRWLSRKYPSILVHCVEQKPKEVGDLLAPIDTSQPNPNDIEFDNLYLDMNGIIHPCTHPENKPAPKNEEEMMVLIFEYIDRIFSIVRPRKLLYMAIDGVAPRAKMNQQRSRRFRASKESAETARLVKEAREELLTKGCILPPEKPASEKFDSNCITPGTPFMFRLANNLRFYIHDRLNNDPGWKNIKVILSDANVPGEGEHKIMDYIRRQRAQPDHDPNTAHCLCGADADLIMLGLATHEPNFTIIREEFRPNQDKPCILCGQMGHALEECTGLPKEKAGEFDHLQPLSGEDVPFIFLRLNILKEYLERELRMDGLPFEYDFERALDDWVFMCFFVGNDFLPHLPSLEIREGAIDRLTRLYKNTVYKTGGYLTDSGVVSLERVQLIMQELGTVEDEIFKKRRKDDLDFRRRRKEKDKRMRNDKPRYIPGGMFAPQPLGKGRPGIGAIQNPRQEAYRGRMQNMSTSATPEVKNENNLNAALALKSMMSGEDHQRGEKRKHEEEKEEDSEPEDNVKLWEDGFKDRYYKNKFDVDENDVAFRHNVADHYVRGLCWVLRYYYQGCASWKWYFPYHYAPFASDFVNIARLSNDFERNTEPFKPLEQLMGVFPAGSKQHVPTTWQNLMTNPESPIIDFYPVNFKIDKNGKKYDWQGVALLPFVDEKRLWKALDTVYPDLTSEERHRNGRGNDRLFVHSSHSAHSMLEALYEGVSKNNIEKGNTERIDLNPDNTQGMAGKVFCDQFVVLTGETFHTPIPQLASVVDNRVISVQFKDPQFDADFIFKACVLPNANPMPRVLKPEDFEKFNRGNNWFRPQLGFQPHSGYRGHKDMGPANRMIRAGVSIPPPVSFDSRGGRGGGYGRGRYNGGRQQGGFNQRDGNQSWNRNNQDNYNQRNMQGASGGYGRHHWGSGNNYRGGGNNYRGGGNNQQRDSYNQGGGRFNQNGGGYNQGRSYGNQYGNSGGYNRR